MDISAHALDVIKTSTGCVAIAALIFTAMQLRISRSTILLNSIRGIHDENMRIRKLIIDAATQRDELVATLKTNPIERENIYYLYSDARYNAIREIGYHYEYIGLMVKNNVIPCNILFSLIQFPDKFWIDSQIFVQLMRNNYTSDFWENFDYLQKRYEKTRGRRRE